MREEGVRKMIPSKIEHYDDERSIGNSIIVTLKKGWRFEDHGEHVRGFDTKQDAMFESRSAMQCECHTCKMNDII